ncbi:MAG TPA: hypothetical protein V6C97_01195 [Oculatellaceae cyanobacterium]
MSTLDKAHPLVQASAPDASHKFHLDLSVTDTQIRNAEYAAGAVGAVVLGVVALRIGKLALLEKSVPEIETAANSFRADLSGLAKVTPKQNYYKLKDGVELQFSPATNVYGKTSDLISVSHPIDGEAHLLRDGSRIVQRYDFPNFYDEAGKGIRIRLPGEKRAIVFQNHDQTIINKKTFGNIEKCFLTGSTQPLESIPNLFEQVSKF